MGLQSLRASNDLKKADITRLISEHTSALADPPEASAKARPSDKSKDNS